MLVGPAGYGKTTLLADWAEDDARTFCWVALDDRDNDTSVVVRYLLTTLERVGGRRDEPVDERLVERDPVAALVTAADAITADVVVVLDGYHHITDAMAHEAVLALVDRSPANVTVAIASRADLPLPVARLRASGDLVELRATDLSFTVEETDALINGTLESGLDLADIASLHDRTEGWPAAVYLAYLSFKDAADRQAVLRGFGASNRYIDDYLTEQVLAKLDPRTLRFMLATSIVDQMTGPLVDAITEGTDGARQLIALERANLFVLPLDDTREWYRYHKLVARSLSMELLRTAAEMIPDLHLRASRWFEGAGDMDRAIRHAISGVIAAERPR